MKLDRSFKARRLLTTALLALCSLAIAATDGSAQSASVSKTQRKVLVTVQPKYPPILEQGRYEGKVTLAVTVSANGNVTKVENRGGNPMFSKFAEDAVKQWKFAPTAEQTVEQLVFNFNAGRR